MEGREIAVIVLIHSPFTGPGTWAPVAAALGRGGQRTLLPSLLSVIESDQPSYARLAREVAHSCAALASHSILVMHSGAGGLLDAVTSALPTPPIAALFVDALLPHPGRSWFDTIPVKLAARLRDQAVDGRLPPWPRWWTPGMLANLIPDERVRAKFENEAPRAPISFLDAPAPACAFGGPFGYLRLSAAYTDEAERAQIAGWWARRRDLDHLALITEPELIAADILAFAVWAMERDQPRAGSLA